MQADESDAGPRLAAAACEGRTRPDSIVGYCAALALGALAWAVIGAIGHASEPHLLAPALFSLTGAVFATSIARTQRRTAGLVLILSAWLGVLAEILLHGSGANPATPGLLVVALVSIVIFGSAGAILGVTLTGAALIAAHAEALPSGMLHAHGPTPVEFFIGYCLVTLVCVAVVGVFSSRMRQLETAARAGSREIANLRQQLAARSARGPTPAAASAEQERFALIGQLAAGITHDFNNLLHVIEQYLALETRSGATGAHPEGLRDALVASETATRLARRVLELVRGDAEPAAPLDLGALVRDLSSVVKAAASDEIQLRIAVAAAPLWVLGNAAQLSQLLLNLCSNATLAMPEGGELDISLEADGSSVVLSVCDSGAGMSAAEREQLFDGLYTTRLPSEGTGLGMGIVSRVAAAHGGVLAVDSEPGLGTCVRLTLARVTPAIETVPTNTERSSSPQQAAGCIMVVDDEAAIRRSIGHWLTRNGYRVQAADSADAALAMIQVGSVPDLALIDVGLAGRSGLALLAKIRASFPTVRCVLMSGDTVRGREEAESADGFLPKPFRDEDLRAVISENLAPRASSAPYNGTRPHDR